MGVSKNRGKPKSSILTGFLGYPYFLKHPYMYSLLFSDERQTFWRGNPKLGVIFLYSLTQKIKPVLFCSGSEGPMIELFNGGTN